MSSISTSIELYDRVSAPINNMISALNNMIGTYESVESAMNTGFDVAPINEARRAIDQAADQMNEFEQEIRQSEQQQENLNEEIRKGSSDMDGLTNSVMGLVGAYASFQGVQKLANLSDEYVQTTARLNMINDGLQTTEQLQDKVLASAQRSRASYQSTADAVAKLGLNAGDAFNSTDEIIAFAEQLNKQFVIAGTETSAMQGAMTQLVQALGSGALRGDELNSIFEAAPNLIQTIADYMGVPIGKIKEMAAEGQVTADIVKNAMLSAANETNAQFESMPMTWGQVWTGIMNELYVASQPILELISLFAQNWSVLEPIILGLASAIGLYTIALLTYNAVKGASALIESVHAASLMMESGATFAATAAQHGFNAALLACPLTWIIIAIIAVIAIIYAVIAAINKIQGTTISATGVIMGVIATAGAFILNLAIGLINALIQLTWSFCQPFLGIIEWILNACNGGFNSFGGAVANLIGQIISWFLSLGKVVTTIIDAIFGTDWTGGLSSLQDKVLSWGKNEEAITVSRDVPTIDRIEYSDAYNAGYSFGEGVDESVSNMFGSFSGEGLGDYSGYDASQIPSNIADTAGNTDSIADSMEITSEDLKYLRDIAETEAVNRFTTAEIKVEMTNNNSIASDMDLDGIVDYLANGVNEAMEKAAEGVHE